MASTFTLTSPRFPEDTTVYANAIGERDAPISAVVEDGSAVFSNLREFQAYMAHAVVDGQYRSEIFTTDGGSSGSGLPAGGTTGQLLAKASGADGDGEWVTGSSLFDPAGTGASEASSAVAVHNSDETAVHGIVDTSLVPLVNLFSSSWPTRPDAAVVFWIGGSASTDDPSENMEVGDVWFPHSE